MPRWRWIIGLILRQIWFRAALFSLLSIALALAASVLAPLIPYDLSAKIGAEAVDNILEILASSMLAVTTFSLTAMVSAFSAATQTLTPRVTHLLTEDATAQNALSTFLGGFLFGIVGIIALSTGFYGEKGRVILYVGTILMVVWIAVTLLRWIQHLSAFGRVDDGIRRVERAATDAMRKAAREAARAGDIPSPPPATAAICCGAIGYVTHIDLAALEDAAEEYDRTIHLSVAPGSFVHPGRPIAMVEGAVEPPLAETIRDAFSIAEGRAFSQDPRFGLIVLSEIASRALSPAINDPGTAIAVLGAGTRVLAAYSEELDNARDRDREPRARVHAALPALSDMLEDLFRPIARDGATIIEVGIRLQKSLAALRQILPAAERAISERARDARERGLEALSSEADRSALDALHRELFAA